MDKVSIIIPIFNGELYLPAAIDSVLDQSYKNIELILVNDGSWDNSQEIIDNYIKQYSQTIKSYSQNNAGVASARNLGIMKAEGEYIAFLDQDDIWEKEKLFSQVEILKQNQDIGLVACYFYFINQKGKRLDGMIDHSIDIENYNLKNEMLITNVIGPPSCVLLRKECFAKVGVFDVNLAGPEDRDMWLRICHECKIHIQKKELCGFRLHQSNAHINIPRMKMNQFKFINKHKPSYNKILLCRAYGFVYLDAAREYFVAGKRFKALINVFISMMIYPLRIDSKDDKYKLLLKILVNMK